MALIDFFQKNKLETKKIKTQISMLECTTEYLKLQFFTSSKGLSSKDNNITQITYFGDKVYYAIKTLEEYINNL